MNVIIRNTPPKPAASVPSTASPQLSDEQIQKVASLALTQGLMGTEVIAQEPHKSPTEGVVVALEQVYRGNDRLYIRYCISNLSKVPFRLTAPDISQPEPTQQPTSIISLRDHQLSAQTFASFKAKPGSSVPATTTDSQEKDLAPGQKTTGVITIRGTQSGLPQIYQLHFGSDQNHPVTAEAVL